MRGDKRQWGRIAAAVAVAGAVLAVAMPADAAGRLRVTTVPADGRWVDTGVRVTAGGPLHISAQGSWTDGDTTSGPNGSDKAWPDNFLNLIDLGACAGCARTLTLRWGALEGYIGDNPPAPGSYTSRQIYPEAAKVFFVGAHFDGTAPGTGRLWLNKNADAYSGNTGDNNGAVVVDISGSPPPGDGDGWPSGIPWFCLGGQHHHHHHHHCPGTGNPGTSGENPGGTPAGIPWVCLGGQSCNGVPNPGTPVANPGGVPVAIPGGIPWVCLGGQSCNGVPNPGHGHG